MAKYVIDRLCKYPVESPFCYIFAKDNRAVRLSSKRFPYRGYGQSLLIPIRCTQHLLPFQLLLESMIALARLRHFYLDQFPNVPPPSDVESASCRCGNSWSNMVALLTKTKDLVFVKRPPVSQMFLGRLPPQTFGLFPLREVADDVNTIVQGRQGAFCITFLCPSIPLCLLY